MSENDAKRPLLELRGLRVLVVDDNVTNRRIFEAYVASWGMRPGVAGDASDALAQLQRAAQEGDPYDVALLDFVDHLVDWARDSPIFVLVFTRPELEQFRPGNVPDSRSFCFFLLFGREIERVAQKNVGLALITRVARHNRIEGFGKSNLLHQEKRAVS